MANTTAFREEDIRPADLLKEFFALLERDAERLAERSAEFVEVPCTICDSPSSELAFNKQGFDYRLCGDCESLFVSPRPTPEALADYATQSEAVRFWSTHFYRATAMARREKIFRPRAALVASLIQGGVIAPVQTLVDVGAGYGLFLEEIAALGAFPRVLGVEPDARLASVCRDHGFEVVEKWVEDVSEGDCRADLATAFEVLEHVFDPRAFLAACGRLVRPGGAVLFTTLTISGFDLQVLWDQSRSISPPQHLNFPSIKGVTALIERSGFELLEVSTPGELDVDIVRNVLDAGSAVALPRFAKAIALADNQTRSAFQTFLQTHLLSSHLRCVVRRRNSYK